MAGKNLTFVEMCEEADISSAKELAQGNYGVVIIVVSCIFFLMTFALFLEQLVFVVKNFRVKSRLTKTIWVLAVYPIFSFCALIGVAIPRAGTIVDLVMDTYLAAGIYQFLQLILDYLSDGKRQEDVCNGKERVRMRGPPVCCCCFCLPKIGFTKRVFDIFYYLTLQIVVIRPMLSFVAAVMWAEGVYIPGYIAVDNAYVYITSINLLTTGLAVYSLLFLHRGIGKYVESFKTNGKWACLQMVLLLTLVPNLLIGVLVNQDVIPCREELSSKSRGDRIYHGVVLILTLPLSFVARRAYLNHVENVPREESDSCQNKPPEGQYKLSPDTVYSLPVSSEWPDVSDSIRSLRKTKGSYDINHDHDSTPCRKINNHSDFAFDAIEDNFEMPSFKTITGSSKCVRNDGDPGYCTPSDSDSIRGAYI